MNALAPQENTGSMITMMSDFQVTQVEERHKTLQYDEREYALGLAEVRKILDEDGIDEMTRGKFMEEKVQVIENIFEQRNE